MTTTDLILVSFGQAAQALQVSKDTIYNLVASGHLPTVTVKGVPRVWSDDLRYLDATDDGLAAVAAACRASIDERLDAIAKV
ncbi:MAG TPA: helix-turn-helix domain-containing protein [Acidobacteriaceae bacterium]|jgi:excisionase family DNA binding protein